MKLSNIINIFSKEYKTIVRDKRTLLVLILLPLVFYPLLIGSLEMIRKDSEVKLNEKILNIYVENNTDIDIYQILHNKDNINVIEEDSANNAVSIEEVHGRLEINKVDDYKYEFLFKYDSTNEYGHLALSKVTKILNEYKDKMITDEFNRLGIEYNIMESFEFKYEDTSNEEKRIGKTISSIIPYFMIISILAGGITVGIDITAGEKERGTIATLLSSKLTKLEIIIGKLAVIILSSLVSAILSVFGLFIALKISSDSLLNMNFPFINLLVSIILLLPLVILTSSIILSLGFYAKSIKEGNSYGTILYLLVIFLGALLTIDGLQLPEYVKYIPVINTIMALKSVFMFEIDKMVIIAAVLINTALSILFIYLAVRISNKEEVLFRT